MTTNDSESPVRTGAKRLRFDRYVLDLDRGCLLLDGSEITLRPKTFAVLRYLVEHSGSLVSKDELFAAVWPNLAVTDDALVQSIGELRRALADEGPRPIKTIPRRGYRFESAVSIIALGRHFPNRCDTGFGGFPRQRSSVEAGYPGACMDMVDYGAHRLARRIVRRSRGFACCGGTVGWSPRMEFLQRLAFWRAVLENCRICRETGNRNSPLGEPKR
jgi:DNA-binding winged helix-turn-helix (wHTH) protein